MSEWQRMVMAKFPVMDYRWPADQQMAWWAMFGRVFCLLRRIEPRP